MSLWDALLENHLDWSAICPDRSCDSLDSRTRTVVIATYLINMSKVLEPRVRLKGWWGSRNIMTPCQRIIILKESGE